MVVGGWWRLEAVGGSQLVGVCGWGLAVGGSWRLAVGGPWGLSFRAVLNKKKIWRHKDSPEAGGRGDGAHLLPIAVHRTGGSGARTRPGPAPHKHAFLGDVFGPRRKLDAERIVEVAVGVPVRLHNRHVTVAHRSGGGRGGLVELH